MTSRVSFQVPSEDEFREKLQRFFSKHGYVAHGVPRDDDGERADLLIENGLVRVLLELKIKGEDEDEDKRRGEILDSGEIYEYGDPSTRRNRLSALIKKGVSQLRNTPETADFHLLWLHGAGRYAEHHAKRFVSTLYGSHLVLPTNRPLDVRQCYYFEDSEFFRHRETLVGVIVSSGKDCQLCINDLCLHAAAFRNSSFRQIFGQGYCDPTELEQNSQAYIVDSNHVDRSDKNSVLMYLRNKYACESFIDIDIPINRFEILGNSSLTRGNSDPT